MVLPKNYDEKRTQNDILRALGTRPDLRLWRQNVGVAVPLSALRLVARAVLPNTQAEKLLGAVRPITYGVPGMADLSGVRSDGRRIEIEVKSPRGRQRKEQRSYQKMIERFGAVYVLARTVEEAESCLES
jgi:hypothetical protein